MHSENTKDNTYSDKKCTCARVNTHNSNGQVRETVEADIKRKSYKKEAMYKEYPRIPNTRVSHGPSKLLIVLSRIVNHFPFTADDCQLTWRRTWRRQRWHIARWHWRLLDPLCSVVHLHQGWWARWPCRDTRNRRSPAAWGRPGELDGSRLRLVIILSDVQISQAAVTRSPGSHGRHQVFQFLPVCRTWWT